MSIIVDSREPNKNIKYLSKSTQVKKEFLEVGDYLLPNNIGVERKKGRDLTSSLTGKRIYKQLNNLNQYERPVLAIITKNKWKDFYFNRSNYIHKSYEGLITTVFCKYPKIRILFFEDDEDFMDWMLAVEKKELSDDKGQRPIPITRKARSIKEIRENVLAAIPGVGISMSKKLLKEFKTIHNIARASEKDLMRVDKLGKKTAEKIHNILNGVK
jgi:ERCC4-type nuclease